MYNLPNLLTILRVLLIPIFVGLFYYPSSRSNMFAAIVFVVAALTDLLDGYLARKLKQTTKFGAFLDPVADKIIVCTALVLIVEYYSVHVNDFFPHMNLLISLPAMVIIAREIVVSALREWMAEIGQRAQVAVNWVGKWKTTIQMTAIALLVWRYNDPMIYSAVGLLGVATILTIWSMVMYLKVGLSHMGEGSTPATPAAPAAEAVTAPATAPVAATPASSQSSAIVPPAAESAPDSASAAVSATSTTAQGQDTPLTPEALTAPDVSVENTSKADNKPNEI